MTYLVTYMDGDREGTKEQLTYISRAGLARVVYANGDTFEGLFNDMKQRHGKGVYSYSTAPVADGEDEPEADDAEGKSSAAAATFTGDFRFGKKEGFGKMKYPNGSVYNGAWTKDLVLVIVSKDVVDPVAFHLASVCLQLLLPLVLWN